MKLKCRFTLDHSIRFQIIEKKPRSKASRWHNISKRAWVVPYFSPFKSSSPGGTRHGTSGKPVRCKCHEMSFNERFSSSGISWLGFGSRVSSVQPQILPQSVQKNSVPHTAISVHQGWERGLKLVLRLTLVQGYCRIKIIWQLFLWSAGYQMLDSMRRFSSKNTYSCH